MAGDAIGQARAEARWLAEVITKLTGERIPVQPVVVFPGWFIVCDRPWEQPVWVCNPKGLPTFIRRAPVHVTSDQARRIAFLLAEFAHARLPDSDL